jgi:hypothetical protein
MLGESNFRITSMRNEEILIAPFFELRVKLRSVSVTSVFKSRMEMSCIFFVEIVRGQIRTPSEPPLNPIIGFDFEISVVKMDCGDVRIPGMDNAADSQGVEWQGLPF